MNLPKATPNQRTMRVAKDFLDAHPNGFKDVELAEVMQGLADEAVQARLDVLGKTRMRTHG